MTLAGQEAPKEHVTKGYVRIVRETLQQSHSDQRVEVDWVATGGHKVTDLLKRVGKDVIAKKPTIVFIQIGVNDAGAGVTKEMFLPYATTELSSGLVFLKAGLPLASITPSSS